MQTYRNRRSWFLVAGCLLATLVAGCASQAQLTHQYLDERTGVTVTTVGTPLILYRDNPALAAHARSFLNVGPVEINRMGAHRFYLWVGIWNTMEAADEGRLNDVFDSITLFADGEPLLLRLAGSTPSAIGTSALVYVKPVASASDAYYEVTADQIRLIAGATEIRVRPNGARSGDYLPWDKQRAAYDALDAFLDRAFF